jgi:hypothetical protein
MKLLLLGLYTWIDLESVLNYISIDPTKSEVDHAKMLLFLSKKAKSFAWSC